MGHYNQHFEGLVLSVRPHKEKDALVKLLTKEAGKRMFFVRRLKDGKHPLAANLQPGVWSDFVGDLQDGGLCFLKDAGLKEAFSTIRLDPSLSAYLAYFLSLVELACEEVTPCPEIFERLVEALQQLEKGQDGKVLQVALEWQMLKEFGLGFSFAQSALSGQPLSGQKIDFILSPMGFVLREELTASPRLLSPKACRLAWLLGQAPIERLGKIEVEPGLLDESLKILGLIYRDYAGVNLASRHYLKKMEEWMKMDWTTFRR